MKALAQIALATVWFFTDYTARGFNSRFWPVLGFLFMPCTTLTYLAAMLNNAHQITGWWVVLLVVAVVIDLHGDTTS
ncbi:MAG TPA: hypothetical protein VF595_16085 [Tepidisphaeraceae bacterium]|jgi:hypothetical protein